MEEKIIKTNEELGDGRVLAEFFTPNCRFCRAAEPVVAQVEREVDDAEFIKINAEECPELCSELGIRSVPTFVLFEGGREMSRASGLQSAEKLKKLLEN